MVLSKNPILVIVGILALAIFLAAGCAKTPKSPNADIPPDTRITTFNVEIPPDSATYYWVTVNWAGSDQDGAPEYYRYWVDAGETTGTFDASVRMRMNFSSAVPSHAFYAQSRDNEGTWDPTPAYISIPFGDVRNIHEFLPSTIPVTVPPDGALTSEGVKFIINGTTLMGAVLDFQWAVDDTSGWTTVPATFVLSSNSTLELVLAGSTALTVGAHTVFVRAIDNWGNIDESPLSMSFQVVDTLRPDLYVVAGPIPNAFYFLPGGGNTVDLAATWFGDATWYYSTLQFRYAVDDSANWSAYQDASTATLTGLTAGLHAFYVQATDLAGHSTTFSTNFGIGQLVGDRGILVVNGIDWGTYPEAVDMYSANVPFGTHSFAFWDFFSVGAGVRPDNVESVLIGEGSVVPGDTLGHFRSMVMLVNNYNGDLEIYNSMVPLILSYLDGGGNVAIGCRYGASFITGGLQYYGVAPDSLLFNNIGVNPSMLVSAAPGLVDIPRTASSSLTDLLQAPVPAGVTVLFTVPNYTTSVGGVLIQPQGKGSFVFIAGRSYRFDFAAEATDYDYILTNYFGEE